MNTGWALWSPARWRNKKVVCMTEAVLTPAAEQSTTEPLSPVAETAANGVIHPDISHIITEDDEPVDNLPSEKQQRLLVEPLYTSTLLERPFLAAANVGVFGSVYQTPVVPDMFLSLEVEVANDWWAKEHRSYFVWEFGKPPDVAIEIVSNRRGGESTQKMVRYAQLRVTYYAIFDPQHLLQSEDLRVY
ncbi:MAG: Uma2 family endonuclease, partial [Caldilineaceae bacterium]|nr:Uma2 family endonuclease [Caldilineaceae bacterium]